MGNELANPLNGVIGLARLMLESELDCHQKTATKTIIQSCHALLQTLDDIVDSCVIGEGLAENPEQLLGNTGTITALIDRDYVNKMKSDFQNPIFRSLLEQYCNDSEQVLRDLEGAVERQDTSKVKNLLHLLKGCSANFGASAVVRLCAGHTKRFKHSHHMTRQEFARLKQTYESTKDQLQQVVGSGF
jgi:HPt (histidine-containing phosphotransfer) domain-containing protein